jgi:hypothetical protein
MTNHEHPVEEAFDDLPTQPSERYYNKISQMDWYTEGDDTIMEKTRMTPVQRWSLLAAALVLALGVGFLVTPAGQAAAADAWQAIRETIGGQRFARSDTPPFDGQTDEVAPTTFMPLEEAQATYGFALPTDLPAGVALSEVTGFTPDGERMGSGEAMVSTFGEYESITITYTGDLSLFVATPEDLGLTLGSDVPIREVEVNGQPAALYPTGAYEGGEYVTRGDSLTLAWSADGFRYELRGDFDAETLLTIAESFE